MLTAVKLLELVSSRRPGPLRFARTVAGLSTLAVLGVFGSIGYNGVSSAYWLMLIAILPLFIWVLLRRAVPRAVARVTARKRWKARGSAVERVRYTRFEELRSSYVESTRTKDEGFVDDRTWADLGLDGILHRIDICLTIAGRNELARTLRHALPSESTLADRSRLMDLFSRDKAERLRVAGILANVGEESDADPATLLWGAGARPDALYPLFISMCLFSIASIITAVAFNPTLGIFGIIVAFFSNMWIYYRKARHLSVHIPALRILSRMIEASGTLEWFGLERTRQQTSGARRAYGWLLTGAPSPTPSLSGDIMEMLFLYVKIYFQIDLIAYNRIARTIGRNLDAYRALYRGVGTVDALFALASYRARRRQSCEAEFDPGSLEIHLERGYHPLVPKAVPNSMDFSRPGAIVTGTNMAGKSTFLRMVGINALFAQVAGYAFAAAYRGPRFRIMSSIERHDDLAEGKSFYYDEAERIYTMIEEAKGEEPVLLLIDELLSGTNSLERESASVAILHYLADRNALTIAATHDIAIARGVADRYALRYFTDSADENGLTFDYLIHDGVVQTRNAIKLLRLIGYPEDVIENALRGS